jgi:hypothetical protein
MPKDKPNKLLTYMPKKQKTACLTCSLPDEMREAIRDARHKGASFAAISLGLRNWAEAEKIDVMIPTDGAILGHFQRRHEPDPKVN